MIRATITLHNFYLELVMIPGMKFVLYIDVYVSSIRVKDISFEHFELCFIGFIIFKTTIMHDMLNF